jgi:hypothetical protein
MRRESTEELGCQAGQLQQLDLINYNYNEFQSDTGILLAPINLEQVAALEMLRAAGVQHSRDITSVPEGRRHFVLTQADVQQTELCR